jgi:hypothetical protein
MAGALCSAKVPTLVDCMAAGFACFRVNELAVNYQAGA